jgi:hypothetical protein
MISLKPEWYIHIISMNSSVVRLLISVLYILSTFAIFFGIRGVKQVSTGTEYSATVLNIVVVEASNRYNSYINVTYMNHTCLAYVETSRRHDHAYNYALSMYPIGSICTIKYNGQSCYLYPDDVLTGLWIFLIILGSTWITFPILEILGRLLYNIYIYVEEMIYRLFISRPVPYSASVQSDYSSPNYI